MDSKDKAANIPGAGDKTKCLVVGAAGFVGKHLLSRLVADGCYDIYATKLDFETIDTTDLPGVQILDLDITKKEQVTNALTTVHPGVIFHLAAQSSVALSFQKPELTMQINVMGSLHLMEAIREICPEATAVLIGSAEQYGPVPPERQPVRETEYPKPVSPYAISKTAVESMSSLYAKSYGLRLIMVRAFNHIGPGQLPIFVVSDFARQIARIEKGLAEPVIEVGNLTAKRDFTDVRDIVRGYTLLARTGRPGEIYNIGSGSSIAVEEVLKTLLTLSPTPIEVRIDPKKFRPTDVPEFVADITKIQTDTSWRPEIPLSQSLSDTLTYWRKNV